MINYIWSFYKSQIWYLGRATGACQDGHELRGDQLCATESGRSWREVTWWLGGGDVYQCLPWNEVVCTWMTTGDKWGIYMDWYWHRHRLYVFLLLFGHILVNHGFHISGGWHKIAGWLEHETLWNSLGIHHGFLPPGVCWELTWPPARVQRSRHASLLESAELVSDSVPRLWDFHGFSVWPAVSPSPWGNVCGMRIRSLKAWNRHHNRSLSCSFKQFLFPWHLSESRNF